MTQTPLDPVQNALRWLFAHQSADGRWESAGFGSWCDGRQRDGTPAAAAGAASDAGKPEYDVGVTGLALLAFLGAGYTQRSEGPYGKAVKSGLHYLRGVQDDDGCFGSRTSSHYAYNHAIATLAMAEAYGMTGSTNLKVAVQRALDFIALARNPYVAWRYGVKPGDSDTSVTGWMTMALASARQTNAAEAAAGRPPIFALDAEAFDGVRAWLDKMTDPDTGRVGYITRGGSPARATEQVEKFPSEKSESMTAVGVFVRLLMGANPKMSLPVKKGAELIASVPPAWNPRDGSIDFISWYHGTLAMFQLGGPQWKAWEKSIEAAIVKSQRFDGDFCGFRGSWDPIDPWGPDGGRVYSTALMTLCCEVSFRYDKVFGAQPPK